MTVRLFDELDAGPEPELFTYTSGNLAESPRCWQCHQTLEDAVHHIDPETGDYDCTN